jgi:hypothetical protein
VESKQIKSNHIFINCPFDPSYRPIFDAVVFAVCYLGFVPRYALEDDDAGEFRLSKIERVIEECRLGINDLSAVELDAATGLPRFNMPLELGLFLGCKRFGPSNQQKKRCLILDREGYRYRNFISDIAGHNIRSHNADPALAIREIRDWLQAATRRNTLLPGGGEVFEQYGRFSRDLPNICRSLRLEPERLTFLDFSGTVARWLQINR